MYIAHYELQSTHAQSCVTALQGMAGWEDEAIQEVVGKQSKQLGLLMHLVHWRPSFPLTHTAHSFWHKLHASLTHGQLITLQELQLIKRLAGQLSSTFCFGFADQEQVLARCIQGSQLFPH